MVVAAAMLYSSKLPRGVDRGYTFSRRRTQLPLLRRA